MVGGGVIWILSKFVVFAYLCLMEIFVVFFGLVTKLWSKVDSGAIQFKYKLQFDLKKKFFLLLLLLLFILEGSFKKIA